MLEQTRILGGIQFKRFMTFIMVETNQRVCNKLNVILTQETSSPECSSMAAKSKRRALAFHPLLSTNLPYLPEIEESTFLICEYILNLCWAVATPDLEMCSTARFFEFRFENPTIPKSSFILSILAIINS